MDIRVIAPLLPRLFRRLRSPGWVDLQDLRMYRRRADPIVVAMRAMRDEWLSLLEYEREEERLANVASVNRWELRRFAEQMQAVDVPRLGTPLHRTLTKALDEAARGCQLLANGHRCHGSYAICDGQLQFVGAIDALDPVLKENDQLLGD